jgi:tripartite-type tricarboxylate transporter receptor subunit TctC
MKRRIALSVFVLTALLHAGTQAQSFPSKPVTIFVAYAPGGPTDTFARALGASLTETLHQPVIVENRPGGAGQIAVNAVRQAPADGHTLYIGDLPTMATNVGLMPNLSYQPQRDLRAVTLFAVLPGVLLVPASSPYKTLAELVAGAKSKQLTYASHGIGSGAQLFSILFAKKIGADMVHVPYKGSTPGLQAVMTSEVDFFYDTVLANQHVASGRMRALAVGHDQRLPLFPNVPTLRELGYADIVPTFWYGAVVKAGTPPEAVVTLDTAIRAAVASPQTAKRLTDQGVVIKTSANPDEFKAYMDSEIDRWTKVIREAGLKVE